MDLERAHLSALRTYSTQNPTDSLQQGHECIVDRLMGNIKLSIIGTPSWKAVVNTGDELLLVFHHSSLSTNAYHRRLDILLWELVIFFGS